MRSYPSGECSTSKVVAASLPHPPQRDCASGKVPPHSLTTCSKNRKLHRCWRRYPACRGEATVRLFLLNDTELDINQAHIGAQLRHLAPQHDCAGQTACSADEQGVLCADCLRERTRGETPEGRYAQEGDGEKAHDAPTLAIFYDGLKDRADRLR